MQKKHIAKTNRHTGLSGCFGSLSAFAAHNHVVHGVVDDRKEAKRAF